MVRCEGDVDVRILGSYRSRIVISHIDAADRQAEVVDNALKITRRNDLADAVLNLIAQTGGFLDPGAGLRADVQFDLAGIDSREEILTEPRGKAEGQGDNDEKD